MAFEGTDWQDCLLSAQEAAAQVDYSRNGWTPPGSSSGIKYTCRVVDVSDKPFTRKDGTTGVTISVRLAIVDGPYESREFTHRFFIERGTTELKGAYDLQSLLFFCSSAVGRELAGESAMVECVAALQEIQDAVLEVKVQNKAATNNKGEDVVYTNLFFNAIVPAADVVEAEVATA